MLSYKAIWTALGIDETSDIRDIKRAYARRVKVVRPDLDPEAFQILRQAYEQAIAMAEDTDGIPLTEPVALAPTAPGAPPADVTSEAAPVAINAPAPPLDADPHPLHTTAYAAPEADRAPQAPSQPTPAEQARRAHEVARQFWSALLERCGEATDVPFDLLHVGQIEGACQTVEKYLAAMLRSPALEPLAARHAFGQMAYDYCAQQSAAPVIRMVCLKYFRWREEQQFQIPSTPMSERVAIERALGDEQYHSILMRAHMSSAIRDILAPGRANIRTFKFYLDTYRDDVRKLLAELDGPLSSSAQFHFDHENLSAWHNMGSRPWPAPATLFLLLLGGLFAASLMSAYLEHLLPDAALFDGKPLAMVLIALVLTPVAAITLYPLAHHRVMAWFARIRAIPKVRLGFWMASALLSCLTFLPAGTSENLGNWTLGLMGTIAVANWLIMQSRRAAHLATLLVVTGAAYLPTFALHRSIPMFPAWLFAMFTVDMVLSTRVCIYDAYNIDMFTPRLRMGMLLSGVAVAGLVWMLGPVAPIIATLIGWAWFLVAAGSADLFCAGVFQWPSPANHGLVWIAVVFLLFRLPGALPIDSPVAPILHIQAIAGISITLGLVAQGYRMVRQWWGARARRAS